MKRTSILPLLVLALCSLAWSQKAQCTKPTPPPAPTPTQPVGVTVANTNNNSATSSSTSSSSATASQGQTQNQSATGGNANASNGGNTLQANTNVPRQAPPAYAPTVFSGACLGGFSGGASGPVGGISFGGTKADKVCQSINLAQVFLSQGNYVAAAKILCSTKPAKDAKLTQEDCLAFVRPAPPVIIAPEPAPAPEPRIIVIEPPITVTATPAQVREASAPAPQSHKPVVHKAKPCATNPVVPPALREPLEK